MDLYGAPPSLAEVRSLLGDSSWWPGPPSFGVRPLDTASMTLSQRFAVIQRFVHIGTAETFDVQMALCVGREIWGPGPLLRLAGHWWRAVPHRDHRESGSDRRGHQLGAQGRLS